MLVLFNPADLRSLQENFPDFVQGDTVIIAYGKSIARALEDGGFRVDLKAPTPEIPSVARAVEVWLENNQ